MIKLSLKFEPTRDGKIRVVFKLIVLHLFDYTTQATHSLKVQFE